MTHTLTKGATIGTSGCNGWSQALTSCRPVTTLSLPLPLSTSFLVNSRTLMGCTDTPYRDYHHQRPLGVRQQATPLMLTCGFHILMTCNDDRPQPSHGKQPHTRGDFGLRTAAMLPKCALQSSPKVQMRMRLRMHLTLLREARKES